MGTWGVKIDQNDMYADLHDSYIAFLKYGICEADALKYTLQKYEGYVKDAEEQNLFWISLADIMWKVGRLTDEVKEKAISCINSEEELSKWYEISKESGDERKTILENLKERLNSIQLEKKKYRKKRYKSCEWSNGDIYRYIFTGEVAEKYNMVGMCMILQKIDDYIELDSDYTAIRSFIGNEGEKIGNKFPVIRFWISSDSSFIPSFDNRNDCIANIGNKDRHNPKDYRFYIMDFPGKYDKFEYICNSKIIVPDNEDSVFIKENNIKPRHLTWRFFDKHVIGRFLFWTKDIDIFKE